jgi:hypothetical protein
MASAEADMHGNEAFFRYYGYHEGITIPYRGNCDTFFYLKTPADGNPIEHVIFRRNI